MSELQWMPATEISAQVREGKLTPNDVAEAMINQLENVNPEINAVVYYDKNQIIADAEKLTREARSGDALGPLHGVPFTIKDMTPMKGLPLTFGMKPLMDNIADTDAVVYQRLRDAGGLFIGRTNTPESGYYGGTDNHLFGPTHNPWKRGTTAGGSSGGAAAAVAAGIGPLAEGSDGAGSVRIPAAMCGVVGMKPTTGTVPQNLLPGRFFNWAYHGPLTRTVADNALMLDVMAGPHNSDPLSTLGLPESYSSAVLGDIQGLRIAWSEDLGVGYVDPEVLQICRAAVEALTEAGAVVDEQTPSWGNPSTAMWNAIWVPGFASEFDMFDWDAMHGEVDENLIELMHEAQRTTAVDVGRAETFRGKMWDTWTSFMDSYDVLVSPTLGSAAFPHTQFAPDWLEGKSLREQILDWLLTYPFNMLNNPAITVPAGFTTDGRPVGLQIAARHREEGLLYRVARHLEELRPWADRKPGVLSAR